MEAAAAIAVRAIGQSLETTGISHKECVLFATDGAGGMLAEAIARKSAKGVLDPYGSFRFDFNLTGTVHAIFHN